MIKGLSAAAADFAVLFFNPNIHPKAEFDRRAKEQQQFCESLGVRCIIAKYDHSAWLAAVRGLEAEHERGRRCATCFEYRISIAAQWAILNGFDTIATTFGVSKWKSQAQVDAAAAAALPENLNYIHIPNDENLRRELASKMYRQSYCGCEFSETFIKS